MRLLSIALIFIVLITSYHGYGQSDTSQPGKWDVSVRGNINVGAGYYHAFTGGLRTSPFSQSIGGTLSVKIGKIDLPISLVYRDHSLGLTKPFFNIGMSPQWGKTKFHLGYRNLQFSRYTLGGATFFGVGAETRISFLRLGGMYGSFQNPFAQRDTIVFGTVALPTFERKGYSVKLGFGNEKNYFDLVLLKVKDQVSTLPIDSENIFSPKDNLVFGVNGNFNFSKYVTLRLDGAVSGMTNDLNSGFLSIEEPFVQKIRSLLDVNGTTNLYYAGESELRLNFKKIKPYIRYRRISPYYKSFGINYLTSDTEDITVGIQGVALKNTLRFVSQVGVQRNNVLKHKTSESKRFVGTASISYQSKSPFRLQVQYNNYDISIEPTQIELNDTFRLARIMHQGRVTPSYTIKGKTMHHTITVSAMMQGINSDITGRDEAATENKYISTLYSLLLPDKKISAGVGLEYNTNQDLRFVRDRYGVTTSFSKPFFKNKLNATYNFSLYNNLINGKNDGAMIRTGCNAGFRFSKKQSIHWSIFYINRQSILFGQTSDIQSRIHYNYNF